VVLRPDAGGMIGEPDIEMGLEDEVDLSCHGKRFSRPCRARRAWC
jgi:phage tail tube protein FII